MNYPYESILVPFVNFQEFTINIFSENVVSLLMLFNFNLLKYYLVNICINNSGPLLKGKN